MTTHINRYSIALIGSFAIATFAFTHPLSADSGPDVRKVIKVMDAMCLSIAENQIMVEANGTLSMFPMRLAAGAKVQATYQSRDVAEFFEGASAKIKSDQADAVRDCMKPQIAKVLSMLEGKPIPPLNVNYSKDSGNINNSVNNTNSNNRNYNNNNSVTNNNNTVNNNAVNNNNNSVNNSNNYNIYKKLVKM